jgi:radical SAM protein with 4Fe4S-binding SPASM domain
LFYRLKDNVALRKWKYVDRAVYVKGADTAFSVSEEEFKTLMECDGEHDLQSDPCLTRLMERGFIEECRNGDRPDEWSLLKEYDNLYFPRMNLMITGKCNMNCLHCFNAKDNAPLNSELSYEQVIDIIDQADRIGVHAFTLTGGEPLVHRRFLDIVKAIHERNMHVFELNTNGVLITQELLTALKDIGCRPAMKISFDGIGYHNWMRQNPKAEELAIRAIKLCKRNGFEVRSQTQINRKNIDSMMETARMLNGLGVEGMRMIRTTEAPRWEKNSPQSSLTYEEYYGTMLEFAREYMDSGMKMNIDIWQFIRLFPSHHSYEIVPIACNKKDFNIRIPMCKGNRGMIAVTSSGEVVPCLQMSGYFIEKGISLGNLFRTPLEELVKTSPYLDIATAPVFVQIVNNDKCADCKYYKACTGGCPALGLLYSQNSDFYHEDVTKCIFFENGWYEKVTDTLKGWHLINPLDI